MTKIELIDTTLRDGHQSLWALGMTNEMMMPTVEPLDRAGFDGIEFWIPQIQLFKAAVDLGENSMHWLDEGAPLAKETRLRLHGGMETGFRHVPKPIHRLLLERMVDRGVTVNRCSDPWNNFDRLSPSLEELTGLGFDPIANLTYSVSPIHTDEYYEERARQARDMSLYRICFKDVGGLLTPERARVLMPKIVAAAGDLEVEFHAHCNSGLAPLCVIEAAKAGMRHIHTAIPPLSDGSSQPSVFTAITNLTEAGFDLDIDVEALERVSQHFTTIAKRDGLPIGRPYEYDLSIYRHQVPGGMISNLEYQMAKVGKADRIDETLEEAAQVRADFGYPIMITPLSQFVGTQAALNVIAGERYKVVSDNTVEFALGYWGDEAIEYMDQDVRDKILSSPRTKQLIDNPPKLAFVGAQVDQDDVTLEAARRQYGTGISDEELFLRAYAGEKGAEVYRSSAKPAKGELLGQNPVIDLLSGLRGLSRLGSFELRTDDFRLGLSSTSSRR